MNEQYIQNIQKSSAVIVKENREMMGDEKNKMIIMWTPRAGCTITCHALFDLLGLRHDALEFNSHIHDYRMKYFLPYAKPINISAIKNENYTVIKTIMNPFSRAVSCWLFGGDYSDLSFRQFFKELVENPLFSCEFVNLFKYHMQMQYKEGEENYVSKYIKIDKNEIHNILLSDSGNIHVMDVNKYTAPHHSIKHDTEYFVGDIPKKDICHILPKSYRWFYDDEIKELVSKYYKKDIEMYGYRFEDLIE